MKLICLALALAAIMSGSAQATDTKTALGRKLFYDADLSIDGTLSCGTCHEQHRAFTEGNRTHGGVTGQPGRRNVMALANVGAFNVLTWADPRLRDLESQALVPLTGTHPVEMGLDAAGRPLKDRLGADACYRRLFAEAFPEQDGAISLKTVTAALAAFERSLVSLDAPYDHGDLDKVARQGSKLFFGRKFSCARCHQPPFFTDAAGHADPFHRIGEAIDPKDPGLAEITRRDDDRGRFRTPSLRNIVLTAPYLHDGSAQTIAEAIVRHDAVIPKPDPAQLAALEAFLQSLTDKTFISDAKYALPKPGCPSP